MDISSKLIYKISKLPLTCIPVMYLVVQHFGVNTVQ